MSQLNLRLKTHESQSHKSEINQSKENKEKLDGLYECIMCVLLFNFMSKLLVEWRKYLGPAVLLQAYRWISDSRDEEKRKD